MQARAATIDTGQEFPAEDIDFLRQAGALAAPVPEHLSGLGAGTEPAGARLLLALLRALGRGNPAVARLFEAHVNALRLVVRHGTPAQARRAAGEALAGHLFGLWVTDQPGGAPLRVQDGRLHGSKGPCSGAGHCTRAVVTAATGAGVSLLLVALSGREPVEAVAGMQGMRGAANGVIALDGVAAPADAVIGRPGDYLREPDFSCGAWRTSAAISGALDALVEEARLHLRRRNHAAAPMQQARFGEMLIARETARLWVERACVVAECEQGADAARVAHVNLARSAVEAACTEALRLAERSLGLSAVIAPHPVERLGRDLRTYLRQPAPDEALMEAAAWHLNRPAP